MNDEQHRQHIQEQLQRGQLALFIGADLLREITGLPSRADLARELAHRKRLDESLSLAEVTQQVSRASNRYEFTAFIRDELDTAGKSPQPFHRRVIELAKTHHIGTIITTVYDNLLELAFQEAGVGFNRVVRGGDVVFINPNHPTLIKLYGDAQQPDTLVITEDDHFGLWRDRDKEDVLDEVRAVLHRNTVLFLGYNLSDPDFNLLWREVVDRAGRFARTAYAVWPGLPDVEMQIWRDRGIVILDRDPLGTLSMSYERGLEILRAQLEHTNRYDEFDALQTHLLEDLATERDQQSPADRARVVDSLDHLALDVLGIGFTDLILGRVAPSMRTSAENLSLVRKLNVALTPGDVEPPVQPRLQELPFNALTWKQFEALCAALVQANPLTIDCHLYGMPGNHQQGIDIVATQHGIAGTET